MLFVLALPANGVRRGSPNFLAAGIIVAKLNVLVQSVAFKIILEHQVPAILPQSGHGQIIVSILFPAFILLSLAAPGDQQGGTGEQAPGQGQGEYAFYVHFTASSGTTTAALSVLQESIAFMDTYRALSGTVAGIRSSTVLLIRAEPRTKSLK